MSEYKKIGLFQKYYYERSDGKPLDAEEKLFTLRFDKDDPWGEVCRETLRDHADRIEKLGYNQLAQDLRNDIAEVEARIAEAREHQPEPIPVPQL